MFCGRARVFILALAILLVPAVPVGAQGRTGDGRGGGAPGGGGPGVTWLTQDDFRFGTFIIDRPGVYRLAEDISFNPNSPRTLTAAIRNGDLDPGAAAAFGLPLPPERVDAYHAGFPLPSQYAPGGIDEFSPGGPMDARYDPAGYGIGFFAAIAIEADGVTLDLNGHTLDQHPEHALLMRFFALIELADQPFLPGQGPSDFGDEITAASNVVIRNGTLGRSSHHGIHGNLNRRVTIENVDFIDYEVGAVALNGVDQLTVRNATATNRKDVPVLGTFSSAQFIKSYVDELVRQESTVELNVGETSLSATDVRDALRTSINAVHHDLIVAPNIVAGRPQIDRRAHASEHALFANLRGVVDGNSYSFLLNAPGVAVNGFPTRPDELDEGSVGATFTNVSVRDQWAFINEIPALKRDGAAVIDPVGAVFQVLNTDPVSGRPVTVSTLDPGSARYVGNVVANAQALVAKADLAGAFDASPLDTSRLSVDAGVVDWVEGAHGSQTLAELTSGADDGFFCNGDSMFHVNKGVIAFKIDATNRARLTRTSVTGLRNLGDPASTICGDYRGEYSHPLATLHGYGGATTRAYTFAGSSDVMMRATRIVNVSSAHGSAIGVDALTDADRVTVRDITIDRISGGVVTRPGSSYPPPHELADGIGVAVSADATGVSIIDACVRRLAAPGERLPLDDASGQAEWRPRCRPPRP